MNFVFKFVFVICDYLFTITKLWQLSVLYQSVGVVNIKNEITSLASPHEFTWKAEDLRFGTS